MVRLMGNCAASSCSVVITITVAFVVQFFGGLLYISILSVVFIDILVSYLMPVCCLCAHTSTTVLMFHTLSNF